MYCFFYEPFIHTKVSWFCCCFSLGLVVFFSSKVWWIKRSLQLIHHHLVIPPHQDKVSFAIERYYLSLLICVKEAVRFPPISTKQKRSQFNVNKHWKKHAKGSDIIFNVISVNQHFASTFSMQIFKFFYLLGELACRLLWELIQAMNNHVHITINSWWWEWNGIRWWIKPIKSNFIQNIAEVCIRNHSIIPRDSRRQIQKGILQEGFDTVI